MSSELRSYLSSASDTNYFKLDSSNSLIIAHEKIPSLSFGINYNSHRFRMTMWIIKFVVFFTILIKQAEAVTATVAPLFTTAPPASDWSLATTAQPTGRYFINFSTGLSTFAYSTDGASGKLKLFLKDGSILAIHPHTSPSLTSAVGLVLADPLSVFVINNFRVVYKFSISTLPGGSTPPYALTYMSSRDLTQTLSTAYHLLASHDPTSDYIYLHPSNTVPSPGKYSPSMNSLQYSPNSLPNTVTTYYGGLSATGSGYLVRVMALTTVEIFAITTLLRTRLTAPGTGVNGILNNLNTDILYMATSTRLYTLSISAALASGNVFSALYTYSMSPDFKPLLNFGSYPLLGVFQSFSLLIMDKSNLALIFSYSVTGLKPYSVAGTEIELNNGYFSCIGTTNLDFRTYKVNLDVCISRTGGVCTSCPSGFYLSSTSVNNYCVAYANIPNGLGIDSSTNVLTPCAINNCLICRDDFLICTKCDTVSGYYLLSNFCYAVGSLPHGYGIRSSDSSVQPCSSSCYDCSADYSTCVVVCPPNEYLLGTTCYSTTTVPDKNGLDIGNGVFVSCSDLGCLQCSANYLICNQCDTALGYYGLNTACFTTSNVPDSYGLNTTSQLFVACSINNCKKCGQNYQNCEQCLISSGFYLFNNYCYIPTQLPDTYGIDTTTSLVASCSMQNCEKCNMDVTVCTQCSSSSGYYLLSNNCYNTSAVPDGFGLDILAKVFVPCASPNSMKCEADYNVPTKCNSPYYLILNSCCNSTSFPNGWGLDTSTNKPTLCLDLNCLNCQSDFKICTRCDTTHSDLILLEGQCIAKPTEASHDDSYAVAIAQYGKVTLLFTRFQQTEASAIVTFSSKVFVSNKLEFEFSLKRTGYKDLLLIDDQVETIVDGYEWKIILKLTEEVEDGTLIISLKSTSAVGKIYSLDSELIQFYDYPIAVDHIYNRNSSVSANLRSFFTYGRIFSKAFVQLSSPLLVGQAATAAFLPQTIFSTFLYMRFLNGKYLVYPEMVFDYMSGFNLPFINVQNPFEDFSYEPFCITPIKYHSHDFRCNILYNSGLTLIQLFAVLILNLMIELVFYIFWTRKKRLERAQKLNWLDRIAVYLNSTYGLKYVLLMFQSQFFEIGAGSLLNIWKTSSSAPMIVGLILSCMILTYSAIWFFGVFMVYSQIILKSKEKGQNTSRISVVELSNISRKRNTNLATIYDLKSMRFSAFTVFFADIRAEIPLNHLRFVLIDCIRPIIIHLTLLTASNIRIVQPILVLLIESAFLVKTFYTRIKAKLFDNIIAMINCICLVAYLILHLTTYADLDSSTLQDKIGLSMAIIILASLSINFSTRSWSVCSLISSCPFTSISTRRRIRSHLGWSILKRVGLHRKGALPRWCRLQLHFLLRQRCVLRVGNCMPHKIA